MKLSRFLKIISVFMLLLVFCNISYAHQGRTDSYGGHYNRFNGTYHYHSGEYAGTGSYTKPIEEGGEPIDNTISGRSLQDTYKDNGYINISYSEYINYLDLKNELKDKDNQIKNLKSELDDANVSFAIYTLFLLFITGIICYNVGYSKAEKNKK